MSNAQIKQLLRRTLSKLRENMSPDYQRQASNNVCKTLQRMEEYQTARSIALYCAQRGEINLEPIRLSAEKLQQTCYFPVIQADKALTFVPATLSTPFVNNRYGIPEPDVEAKKIMPIDKMDIMLIPLVAFDYFGTRLGMGGGYYDRILAKQKPKLLIGVAYEFQHQSILARDPWDITLDAVITEKTIYWIPS